MADATSDTIPISVQGADVLVPSQRIFYESTLMKSILALVYCGLAFMFLVRGEAYEEPSARFSVLCVALLRRIPTTLITTPPDPFL